MPILIIEECAPQAIYRYYQHGPLEFVRPVRAEVVANEWRLRGRTAVNKAEKRRTERGAQKKDDDPGGGDDDGAPRPGLRGLLVFKRVGRDGFARQKALTLGVLAVFEDCRARFLVEGPALGRRARGRSRFRSHECEMRWWYSG